MLFPAVTGLIIMIVVICVVFTSFVWVIVIYHMRKTSKNTRKRQIDKASGGRNESLLTANGMGQTSSYGDSEPTCRSSIFDRFVSAPRPHFNKKDISSPITMGMTSSSAPNGAPLLAAPSLTSQHPFTPPITQDSGSEHSSGKDSGVGESHQRSSEDVNREAAARHHQRKSLLGYQDLAGTGAGGLSLKGNNS